MSNTITRKALMALTGLALAGAFSSAQAQVSTNLLSTTTFDPSAGSPWGFGYFYPPEASGFQSYNREYYLPEDFDMTNGMWQYTFDLSLLGGTVNFGTGTGGPLYNGELDSSAFVSTNREDYIITFDARVEGLMEGQTSANGEMQLMFYYPGETDVVKSLQVNLPFQPTSEWQTFRFALDAGAFGDSTSEAGFAPFANQTSELRFGVNFHNPHERFDYDSDNAFYLDNVKVEVVDKPTVAPVPTFGVTMAEWNFDDLTPNNKFEYQWSENPDALPLVTSENNASGGAPNTFGRDGTSGWMVNLDNSVFAFGPPAWAGGGSGGNGPLDYSLFDTNDLASYRVTFDARVDGLAAGREFTAAVLQLHVRAPDDTLSPADENADADFLVRLDFPITRLSNDWQTFSFTLNKANAGGGSKDNFVAAFNQITEVNTQWQIENIASEADWGYDELNSLIIDNFKLERLYPIEGEGLGPITAAVQDNNLVLTWNTPGATLQAADSLTGTFQNVVGAASGYTTPLDGRMRFFRLVQSAQ